MSNVSVTPLMKDVLKALLAMPEDLPWLTTTAIVTLIKGDNEFRQLNGNQMGGPLMALRRLKLVQRRKIQIAERDFGWTKYPVYQRDYRIYPGRRQLALALMALIGTRGDITEEEFRLLVAETRGKPDFDPPEVSEKPVSWIKHMPRPTWKPVSWTRRVIQFLKRI